jgi:hypothetical protein
MIVSLNEYAAGLALCAAAWITSSVLAVDQPAEQMGLPTVTQAAAAPPMIRSLWDIMLELAISGKDPAPRTLAAVLGSASDVAEKFDKLDPQVQHGSDLLTEHSRNLPDSASGRTWLAQQQKLRQEHWYQQLVDMYFADDTLAMALVMFVPRPTQSPKVVEPMFLIRQDDHWRVSLDIDGEVASRLGAHGQQQLAALRAAGELRLTELRDVVCRPLKAPLPFRGTWTTHFRQSGLFLCFNGDGQVTTIVTRDGSTHYSVCDYHLSNDQIVIESQLGPIRLTMNRDQFTEHDGQRFYGLTVADPRIWFPDAPKETLYLQPVHHGDWPVRRPVQNAQPQGEPNVTGAKQAP